MTEVKVLSHDAHLILHYMISKLDSLKYGYKDIVRGCYDCAIREGYEEPEEGKDFIIDYTIEQMRHVVNLENDIKKMEDIFDG